MKKLSIRSRAPAASSPNVRRVMQANCAPDNALEVALRSALHRAGLRFRKSVRPVPDLRCTADVVFASRRACIFIDGCFWHGCPYHFSVPHTNSGWWREKIEDNKARDRRQRGALRREGWHVIRVWEHDLQNMPRVVSRIVRTVGT